MTTTRSSSNSGLAVVGSVDVDVDARPADVPGAHGLGQRVLVDEAAARGVDDDHARLGERELVLADQADRLGGLRQVDGDHVGATEQIVEREQLDAELRGAGGRDVRVVGDEGDVERREPLRHELRRSCRARRCRPSCPTARRR